MIGAHTGLTEKVLSYKPTDSPVQEIELPKDRASFADPDKSSLLSAVMKVKHLTPDELALLVAERGVVFFRDQDLLTLEGQYELTSHYGIQDRDPNKVEPRHVTILGRGGDTRSFEHSSSAFAEFHSDHSFEISPPSYTMLRMVKAPNYGGDTVFASQTALFNALSPTFKNALQGLHGVHSSEVGTPRFQTPDPAESQANLYQHHQQRWYHIQAPSPKGASAHPYAPCNQSKSLFYNPAFVINIKELKGSEALHILNFLRDHLHCADDLSVRWHWEAGSVAFWDNRIVTHRAIPGGYSTEEREGKRTAVYGEKPYWDPEAATRNKEPAKGDVKLGLDGF